MSQQKEITINIEPPCNENWDTMPSSGNGRFCSNCQKTIIDFSHLSDQELLNYFSKPGSATCGRFHNDQLNKKILALNHKQNPWLKFYKMAAATIAFLILKPSDASANCKKVNISVSPLPVKKAAGFGINKIIISGVVRDQHGHVLESAEVHFGNSLMCTTDKDGQFKFEIDTKDESQFTLITFSYLQFTTARTYHPAMSSTSYDVTLSPPAGSGCCGGTMGIIRRDIIIENMPETIIYFKPADKTLTADAKSSLTMLAEWLRNNPEVVIKLVAHVRNNNSVNDGKKSQLLIRKYLVDQEGISEDRLKTDLDVIPGIKQNIVEIIGQAYNE